jgi:hypothetical protein
LTFGVFVASLRADNERTGATASELIANFDRCLRAVLAMAIFNSALGGAMLATLGLHCSRRKEVLLRGSVQA